MRWLRRHTVTRRTVNRACTTYAWKHQVERDVGEYVSNEAFIEAARRCGLLLEPADPRGRNYYVNLSSLLLRRAMGGA